MFGITVESMDLQPVEIRDTIYVPYHAEMADGTLTTYVPYSFIEENVVNGSGTSSEDFRYDPDDEDDDEGWS